MKTLNDEVSSGSFASLPLNWISLDKAVVVNNLLRLNLESEAFLHWLYIPKLNILLSFKHQICVQATMDFT